MYICAFHIVTISCVCAKAQTSASTCVIVDVHFYDCPAIVGPLERRVRAGRDTRLVGHGWDCGFDPWIHTLVHKQVKCSSFHKWFIKTSTEKAQSWIMRSCVCLCQCMLLYVWGQYFWNPTQLLPLYLDHWSSALSTHSKKIVGSVPTWGFICGGCMFFLCLHRFSTGIPGSSHGPKRCALG